MKPIPAGAVLVALALIGSPAAHAGLYADDLSRCLVDASTENDRLSFIKWMFTAIARHPAVKSMSNISEAQAEQNNRQTARLFERLVTETCKDQAVKAFRYEGAASIQSSFQVLGQVAAGSIFANPEVAAGLSELDKYTDKRKFESLFGAAR